MDIVAGAGGDYHTSYWPQASFLSSRGYHFESTFPAYSELKFVPQDGDVAQGKVEPRFTEHVIEPFNKKSLRYRVFVCECAKVAWT